MSVRPQQETPVEAPTSPQRKRTVRRNIAIALGIIVFVIISGLGWWLISPLFLHNNPLANAKPVATVTHTSAIPTESTSVAVSPTTVSGSVTLATGTFIDTSASDHGSGNVTIEKTLEGSYVLHLGQLNISNGPNLHVYLVTIEEPIDASQVTTAGIDLGSLPTRHDTVNISVPAEVGSHLGNYRSAVIYCMTYKVIFTISPLQFSSVG